MNITQFSHIGSQRGIFFSFFFFFFLHLKHNILQSFAECPPLLAKKGWFNWYKNMKRKCFKKEQLHDRYLHIPCTTEVKRNGQHLFKHKSNSSGICNNLHNTHYVAWFILQMGLNQKNPKGL